MSTPKHYVRMAPLFGSLISGFLLLTHGLLVTKPEPSTALVQNACQENIKAGLIMTKDVQIVGLAAGSHFRARWRGRNVSVTWAILELMMTGVVHVQLVNTRPSQALLHAATVLL